MTSCPLPARTLWRITSPAAVRMVRVCAAGAAVEIPEGGVAFPATGIEAEEFAAGVPRELLGKWRGAEAAAIVWGWGWQLWRRPGLPGRPDDLCELIIAPASQDGSVQRYAWERRGAGSCRPHGPSSTAPRTPGRGTGSGRGSALTYHQPSRDLARPSDRTLPDGAGLAATIPGLGPSSIATIPVVPVPEGSLIGLLGYVMTSPVPTRGPHGEPVRLSTQQGWQLKSTLAYLAARADALVQAGRGHLVAQAAAARARHARVSDDPYVPPPRSYVGETVRDAVAYLCPVISEETEANRTEPGGGGEAGEAEATVPPAEGLNGPAPAV